MCAVLSCDVRSGYRVWWDAGVISSCPCWLWCHRRMFYCTLMFKVSIDQWFGVCSCFVHCNFSGFLLRRIKAYELPIDHSLLQGGAVEFFVNTLYLKFYTRFRATLKPSKLRTYLHFICWNLNFFSHTAVVPVQTLFVLFTNSTVAAKRKIKWDFQIKRACSGRTVVWSVASKPNFVGGKKMEWFWFVDLKSPCLLEGRSVFRSKLEVF